LTAIIHGKADTYQNDPRRTKKSDDSSCANKKGWRKWWMTVEYTFRYGHKEILKGEGQELEWSLAVATRSLYVGESKAAAAYARMFHAFKAINEFVEEHFARDIEMEVLQYIRATIWTDLREAEKECSFSKAAIMLRQLMVLREFVDEKHCIEQGAMWRYNLYGKNVSTFGGQSNDDQGGGNSGGGGTGGNRGGGSNGGNTWGGNVGNRGAGTTGGGNTGVGGNGANNGNGNWAANAGMGGGGGGMAPSPFDKYGVAAPMEVYRTAAVSLKGGAYMNERGEEYTGSVCDFCELKHFEGNDRMTFFHHPLRCNKCFRNWRQSPPEIDDPNVAFYVRGGKTKTFAELN
jgi:hypothetical protein